MRNNLSVHVSLLDVHSTILRKLESSLHESGMERTGYKEKICSEKSGCERGCDHWSNFEMEKFVNC